MYLTSESSRILLFLNMKNVPQKTTQTIKGLEIPIKTLISLQSLKNNPMNWQEKAFNTALFYFRVGVKSSFGNIKSSKTISIASVTQSCVIV
ncbi:hypothetical protein HCUR_01101 [Holospora curviuscula]|uniref:Uncharacterized protein n=1 Tax=Holospora curviuscula TaxID=1082868 RepID=A0A2S5R7Y1_9PROT|nr:hypothetical protein HCUR_01101 [Holospora curviuscula]